MKKMSLLLKLTYIVMTLIGLTTMRAADLVAVTAGTRHVFWKAMQNGIQKAAQDNGINIVIRGPVDDDLQKNPKNVQLLIIKSLVDDHVKGIILAPISVIDEITPITFPVPVVLVDRGSDDFKAESLVATDNYSAGKIAAISLKKVLKKEARIGIFRLGKDVVSTTQREAGFIDTAKKLGYQIVLDVVIGHGVNDSAATVLNAVKELPAELGPLDAVFAPNESTTFGALIAAREWAKNNKKYTYHLVGFDYRAEFKEALADGTLYAVVVQDPYSMGYKSVTELLTIIKRKNNLFKFVSVDVVVVKNNNINTPKIQQILSQFQFNADH